jgi:peptide/nickel transport system permease protein
MGTYLGQRALWSAVSLFGLIVLVFFMARLTGSPGDLYLPIDASAEMRAEFARLHGFDQPLLTQFLHFLGNLAMFDFGQSLRQGMPAMELVLQALPTTLLLALYSIGIALVVAVVTGALAAWRPNSVFDRIASVLSLIGASLPNFWVAIVGVLIFAVNLRWVPTSGTGTVAQWILPVAVLAIRPCGLIVQVARSSMISALSSAYVKTARAKGVANSSIIFVHALRNAMLPVITVAGDQAAGIINGAVIVETIFGFPGVGKLMIDSISYRDFAVIQAGVMVTAVAIFLLNVAIDLAYGLLDPRTRTS